MFPERALSGVKLLGEGWLAATTFGAAILYMCGYLSLRSKLTVLGVGIDFDFIDERYLFEGVRFVLYIATIIPNLLAMLLLIALLMPIPLAILALVLLPIYGRTPSARGHSQLTARPNRLARRAAALRRLLWRHATRPCRMMSPRRQKRKILWVRIMGVFACVIIIQLLLRRVYDIGPVLPEAEAFPSRWPATLMGDELDTYFYFHLLVIAVLATGALYVRAVLLAQAAPAGLSRIVGWVFGLTLLIQLVFLPINYGTLVSAAAEIPVLGSIGGKPLAEGECAWLLWEGSLGITYFVEETDHGSGPQRKLITLPFSTVERVDISGYDPLIVRILARGARESWTLCPQPNGVSQ